MHLYEKFQSHCLQKGVSEAEAYKAMGISRSQISRWRSAQKKGVEVLPRWKTAQKLAEYFNVDISVFMSVDMADINEGPTMDEFIKSLFHSDSNLRGLITTLLHMTPLEIAKVSEYAEGLLLLRERNKNSE